MKIALVLAANEKDWRDWVIENVSDPTHYDHASVSTDDTQFIYATRLDSMRGLRVDEIHETLLFHRSPQAGEMRAYIPFTIRSL